MRSFEKTHACHTSLAQKLETSKIWTSRDMSSTEPQSIVHHVARLERKARGALIRTASWNGSRRGKGKKPIVFPLDDDTPLTQKSPHRSADQKNGGSEEFSTDLSSLCDSTVESESGGIIRTKRADHLDIVNHQGTDTCRTIDLPDLVTDYVVSPAIDKIAFIHFFNIGSAKSESVDQKMKQLEGVYRDCEFLRADSKVAPLVASRLGLGYGETFSGVIALKNGDLLDNLSVISSEASELSGWIQAVTSMQMMALRQ